MSRPLIRVDKALYHLATTPFDWSTLDDLNHWRVGGSAGYYYGAEWNFAVSNHRLVVETVATDEQSLRKRLNRRVDVIAMETDVAEHLMRSLLSPEEAKLIRRHPRLLAGTALCLALSRNVPGNAALLARFNRGLQRLRDSGQYDAILAQIRPAEASVKTPSPNDGPRAAR